MKIAHKPADVGEVQGVLVLCSETEINDLLGFTFQIRHDLADMIKKNTLDDLKDC